MTDARVFRLTAPEPFERDLHVACARALDRLLMPPAMWFSYPAGASQLNGAQIAQHVSIGLKRGLPDIWVLHNGVYCIELKRGNGRLSETRLKRTARGNRILVGQAEVFPKLIASGGVKAIAVCSSLEAVLRWLERWKIPFRSFH